jgi:hypothetical protein
MNKLGLLILMLSLLSAGWFSLGWLFAIHYYRPRYKRRRNV